MTGRHRIEIEFNAEAVDAEWMLTNVAHQINTADWCNVAWITTVEVSMTPVVVDIPTP